MHYHLMIRTVSIPEALTVSIDAHRIFVIDCSGSMDNTIGSLKTHLKNKLALLSSSNDYFTVIWFQHGSHYGTVLEHVQMKTASDLSLMQTMIDRWLDANNGTYFGHAMKLANDLAKKYPEVSQIFFMTDGAENNKNSDTRAAFQEAKNVVIVEYGFDTDHAYLEELGASCNAQLLFSEDFERLSSNIDFSLTNKPSNGLYRVEGGDCFEVVNQDLLVYRCSNGAAQVPFGDRVVYQHDPSQPAGVVADVSVYYAAVWYSLKTRNEELTWTLLREAGDVDMLSRFNNCFSRQEFEDFMAYVKAVFLGEKPRFALGVNKNFQPDNNKFSLLELLKILQQDPKTRVYPYKESMKYKLIGRKTVQTTSDGTQIKYVPNASIGSSIDIVYNKTRANVSLSCMVYGHKIVDDVVTGVEYYRTFTIIRDGVKHIQVLPVSISEALFNVIKERSGSDVIAEDEYREGKVYELAIGGLNVVNRADVTTDLRFATFASNVVKRRVYEAEQKYLKKRLHDLIASVASGAEDDESSGYKYSKTEAKDSYVARELNVKIAQAQSLPKIDENLFARVEKGGSTLAHLFETVHREWKDAEAREVSMIDYAKTKLEEVKNALVEVSKPLETAKFALLACNRFFTDMTELQGVTTEYVMPVKFRNVSTRVTVQIGETIVDV